MLEQVTANEAAETMQVDDGVDKASEVSAGGESNPVGTLVASLKASISHAEPVKAMDEARSCFVRQRVEAGFSKAAAEKEAKEHLLKFSEALSKCRI